MTETDVLPGPLHGVVVLDLSRVLSGPHCGRMLADLGATVIKVEPPEGDMTRFGFPRPGGIASYFSQQNCGKSNVSIDLRQPDGLRLVKDLADTADIVVENFRPGVMDRMGIGFATLAASNPRVILASISGYGQTGPWTKRRAFAPVVGAESGFTWTQGEARGNQFANDAVSHGDVYSGLELLSGILAALYQRERTGRGQWVEVSMTETLLSVNEHVHWELLKDDFDGSNEVPSFLPADYPVLMTGTGEMVIVAGHAASNGNFQKFMALCRRDDLASDPTLSTVRGRRERLADIHDALNQWTSTYTDLVELENALAEQGFAMGVLRTVQDVAETDWARERNAIVEVDNRVGGLLRLPNSPWHFSDAHSGIRGTPRYRGEDNRSVLSSVLGLTDERIDELEQSGVLSSRVPAAQ